MTAKSKPAEPVERLHQLELQVYRLTKTLAEINNDEELSRLVRETEDYRFSPWNFAIVLGCLTYNARLLFEQMEADHLTETDGKGFNVVNERPHGDPERIKPLRVVWPLCRHEDPASPQYVDATVVEAMRALSAATPTEEETPQPQPAATKSVRDRVFEVVLAQLVGDRVSQYHTDALFHADCFRTALEITGRLAVAHLVAEEVQP